MKVLSAFMLSGTMLFGFASSRVHAESPTLAKSPPCSAVEFHQWDFWLGEWRVTDIKGTFQGANEIKRAPSGCGLIEDWHGVGGGNGVSFNGYDAARKTWTQFWVSPGSIIRLEGKLDGQGTMRTEGTITYNSRGIEHLFRGIWTPLPNGAVRQEFYEQDPATKTWANWFTGIYRHPDAPAPAATCSGAAFHQLDFWIGKWDVFDAKTGARAGSSVIEGVYGGCAIRENWSEPGFVGGSLNIYSASDAKWHQTWVDQSGVLREFVGEPEGERLVIVAKERSRKDPHKEVLIRISLNPTNDHGVHQFSDYSTDNGKTWSYRYDYVYKPSPSP